MRFWLISLGLLTAVQAAADAYVPLRVIRAKEVIYASDVELRAVDQRGAETVVGQEARITLYPNRPIRPGDVGPPALVERNQFVMLVYDTGGLRIVTEGRVLGRGAEGDRVRVLNLSSKQAVSGMIRADGWIEVE